jgi:hypothetical protein
MREISSAITIVFLCAAVIAGNGGAFAKETSGIPLWSFSSASHITVVEPIAELSNPASGAEDLLAGSDDDTLYRIIGKGAQAGAVTWRLPLNSTVTAIEALPDVNDDGKPDIAAGDMANIVYCVSGSSAGIFWLYVARGAIECLASLPDINGDGRNEVLAGSEDDTVYCFSGKVQDMNIKTQPAVVLWKFSTVKTKGGGRPKTSALHRPSASDTSRLYGANSLAVISTVSTKQTFGIVVGASSDTVFCLSPSASNGTPQTLWKFGVPGDVWEVTAFSDADGDDVRDVLAASGGDKAYLLSGKTGKELWSCPVTWGAQKVENAGDMNGDGVDDAIIGDGAGVVRCISGKARGAVSAPLWTYTIGDSSTIMSLAAPGDLDSDGRPDCVVGSSNNKIYALSGSGTLLWSADTKGTVSSISAIADVNNDKVVDIAVGSDAGCATVYSGFPKASPVSLPLQTMQLNADLFSIRAQGSASFSIEYSLDPQYPALFEIEDLSGKKIARSFQSRLGIGTNAFDWNSGIKHGVHLMVMKRGNSIIASKRITIVQ